MSRALAVVGVVAVLVGWTPVHADAAQVQFAIDGVPLSLGEEVQVEPSQTLTVGIYVTMDAPVRSFWTDVVFPGDWPECPLPYLEEPTPVLIQQGYVRMVGDWGNSMAAAFYDSGLRVHCIGSFVSEFFDEQSTPHVAAEFDVHIPDLAPGSELGLDFAFGEIGHNSAPYLVPATLVPASLRVVPEPGVLALLGCGLVAMLKRRR